MTREWAREKNWLLDTSLDTLTIGQVHHVLSLSCINKSTQNKRISSVDPSASFKVLNESIEGLRRAGTRHYVPRGLLARSAFRRNLADWDGAARDLDEVEEIAEPGPMRLFLCDMALERARLAFARSEAFAPLNGLIDDSPPKPQRPDEAERKRLHDEAEKQLAIAAEYIETCGYHRRDEELAELQAVLRGDCIFAELPPRV